MVEHCVAQLLGPSIASLFELRNFRKPNFFDTANRMLTAVESFHRCGLVHRDVKPGEVLYSAQCIVACGASPMRKRAQLCG